MPWSCCGSASRSTESDKFCGDFVPPWAPCYEPAIEARIRDDEPCGRGTAREDPHAESIGALPAATRLETDEDEPHEDHDDHPTHLSLASQLEMSSVHFDDPAGSHENMLMREAHKPQDGGSLPPRHKYRTTRSIVIVEADDPSRPLDETFTPGSRRSRVESEPLVLDTSISGLATRRLSKLASRLLAPEQVDRPSFEGYWVCTATWGLDDFLKAIKVSKLQRMAASQAAWPAWEFKQDGDSIMFVNHGPLGVVKESFVVNGPEYISYDARKQKLSNKAMWEGKKLVVDRTGPQGRFREEREIDDKGLLQFALLGGDEAGGAKWGRTFALKK